MKALAFKISFFESLFKVHYTKAFKLAYPTLLPTSVLGIIGNICGYDRKDIIKNLGDFYYGSTYLSGEVIEENITFIQFKKEGDKYRYGVIKSQIYNNSKHIIVVAGEEKDLREKILDKLKILRSDLVEDTLGKWHLIKMIRYPYGGQNDFFLEEIRLLDRFIDIEDRDEINSGYISHKLIKNMDDNTEIELLPVRTKKGLDYFVFIKKGKVYLKEKIKTALNIPIYKIDEFYYL